MPDDRRIVEFYKCLPSEKMFKVITQGLPSVFVSPCLCEKKDFFQDEICKISLQISFNRRIFAVNFGDRKY